MHLGRMRAEAVDSECDVASVAAVGGSFVCPGDREWPSQLVPRQATSALL
ncbi:hypothetical protein ACIA8E_25015 [Streptomyces sp. NPDC051664]